VITGAEAEPNLDFAGLHDLVRPILEELERLPVPQREAVGALSTIDSGPFLAAAARRLQPALRNHLPAHRGLRAIGS
jgi:hypothetical protein